MLFAFTNAPAVFQWLINDVLRDFLFLFILTSSCILKTRSNTNNMSEQFYSIKTNFLLELNNVNFMFILSFLGSYLRQRIFSNRPTKVNSGRVTDPNRLLKDWTLAWPIQQVVQEVQKTEPDPCGGPPERLFVPSVVKGKVLEWLYNCQFSCHPGTNHMTSLASRYFWWPTLIKDIKEYVAACSICTRSKTCNQQPSGLLQPLPIPERPWYHISVDFVTDLTPSQGNTTILTIGNCFFQDATFHSPTQVTYSFWNCSTPCYSCCSRSPPAAWLTRIPPCGLNTSAGLSVDTTHIPPHPSVYCPLRLL